MTLRYGPDKREAAQTHNNLGVLFNQLGKRDQAAAEFTNAIALNPYEQNSFLGRGKIERDEGKLDAALKDFQQGAKVAPSPLAYYWEGRVLEDKGEPGPAADAYRAALKLAPDFREAHLRLEDLQKAGK